MRNTMSHDDDHDPFAFFGGPAIEVAVDESEAYPRDLDQLSPSMQYSPKSAVCLAIDRSLMLRQTGVCKDREWGDLELGPAELQTLEMAQCIMDGSHVRLVTEVAEAIMALAPPTAIHEGLSLEKLLGACLLDVDAADAVRRMVLEFVERAATPRDRECRALQCHILALAHLELYCQANYTGPELSPASTQKLHGSRDAALLHAAAIRHLECDGEWAYTICELPHALFLARAMFLALAEPMRASWSRGVVLTDDGEVQTAVSKINFAKRFPLAHEAMSSIQSRTWRNARAAVIHARLLQSVTHEKVPTLWKECCDFFTKARSAYGCSRDTLGSSSGNGDGKRTIERKDGKVVIKPASEAVSVAPSDEPVSCDSMILHAQLWLEWGLCCHHFSFGDKGKRAFALAQRAARLEAGLTGAMGKRTKHQQIEHAQMLLVARSTIARGEASEGGGPAKHLILAPIQAPGNAALAITASVAGAEEENLPAPADPSVWQHSEWEMGRRMVQEAAGGEEASVREVLLDSMDGGAAENIFLEGGPKFSDESLDQGGELHAVDQAIILALCLDVSNSNPSDGLTTEVMMPYLTRVLFVAKNWMIHSTGLLERSWLEFEQRRTADRAMLQIQALLDQHTTRLTIMQSTYKSIHEDSAPAQDRLHYLHCIVYPAQYELKRDLAFRYLQSAVVVSALGLFRELELWDEVVKCYQLMEKPHRAELVVRDRLKYGETPYMVTALADLTGSDELYERAWTLSRGRYGRAKRTLAKICYDRGDFRQCCGHLDEALAIHPLMPTSWYLKGLATMRLEAYEEAIVAFTRCIQQDMEIGEAWANCGAIHMKMRRHSQAYASLTEALRYKRESWQVIENLMICCLVLEKWREAVIHMNRLLDLRGKSDRPVHLDELRHLALMVADKTRLSYDVVKGGLAGTAAAEIPATTTTTTTIAASSASSAATSTTTAAAEEISDANLPEVARAVETLLVRITNTLKSDPTVWDILARFEAYLGRARAVVDCRVKQFRAMTNEPNWEKEAGSVAAVLACAAQLAEAHDPQAHGHVVGKADVYACKSLLQSAQRRLDVVFAGLDESRQLKEICDGFAAAWGE